ncbi:3-dehydroquinate synthase family protein, partial [Chlamydia psittaci 84-8471/1]
YVDSKIAWGLSISRKMSGYVLSSYQHYLRKSGSTEFPKP